MNIRKLLKRLFKREQAPYLKGDGTQQPYSSCTEKKIEAMRAEADALEKRVQEIQKRMFETIKRSARSDS